MKYTKIRLIGLTNVDLPIVDALPTDPYILKGVDGLGPPEVDVNKSDIPEGGSYRQGRRPRDRQIVAKVGFNPDWYAGQTVADLRTVLYGLLTPGFGDIVTIQLMDGATVVATCEGDVSKLEPNPFSNVPEVLITIDCDGPYLVAPADVNVNLGTMSKPDPVITNAGNAPTGLHLEFTINQGTSSGLWYLTNVNGSKLFKVAGVFIINDKIVVDTDAKTVTLYHAAAPTIPIDAIGYVQQDSSWLYLHGGANQFHTFFKVAGVSSTNYTWTAVSLRPKFWGV